MRKVELTQGKFALVDDADFELVSAFKWCVSDKRGKYAVRNHINNEGKRVRLYLHRFILNLGAGQDVDHIDGDGLNNQRSNLRVVSRSDNMQNQKARSLSGFKGVVQRGGRFYASIYFQRHHAHIGVYDTIEEAAQAHDKKVLEMRGPQARLNFPLTEAEVLKLMST